MQQSIETYRVYAIKYGDRPAATRKDHFPGDPDGDRPWPMDYFVWLITNDQRTFVVDTGYSQETGGRRSRGYIRRPAEGLRMMGVEAAEVQDVIITHLHFDHIGTIEDYPKARIHLQERELHFVTGRPALGPDGRAFDAEDIVQVVRALYQGRVNLVVGSAELAPGLSVHHLGGHTDGTQVVRVHTQRGWVVLASDASHYYENMETDSPFIIAYDRAAVLAGFSAMRALADSPAHIVPGHDPRVLDRYPAPSPELEGIVVQLDVPPRA